jgi:hypothetical protein
MERDKELDALEKSLREPFLEKPEKISIQDGSACWLNGDRACGPDCRAYDAGAPEGSSAVCAVVGGLMDIADGLTGFIKYAGGNLRKTKDDQARAMAAAAPIPNPMPGRKP